MASCTNAPFRCDIVGSFLRPDVLKQARADFNAGTIADGSQSIGEAGAALYALVLDVASGKQTRTEQKGYREISIFKDGVVL